MPGRIIHRPSTPTMHERLGCSGMPPADREAPGTIWQCDECRKQHVVVEGAQYNEYYKAWRALTEANRNGDDR